MNFYNFNDESENNLQNYRNLDNYTIEEFSSTKSKKCALKKHKNNVSEQLNDIFNNAKVTNVEHHTPVIKPTVKPNVPIVSYSKSENSTSSVKKEHTPILSTISPQVKVETPPADKYQDLVNAIKSSIPSPKTCKLNTIYVDLPCFMDKLNVLHNHSTNMMVDLTLLTSNLKTCSYINKVEKPKSETKSENLLSNVAKSLTMPKPETVKLINQPATILLTTGSANPYENNLTMGVTREPFSNQENNNKNSSPMWVIVIIIIIIILLLLFLTNKL